MSEADRIIEGAAIIGQSGGPTAVINQSLVGLVEGLRDCPGVTRVLGMRHGVAGLAKRDVVDLTEMPTDTLEAVAATPSAALGSTREKPDRAYCVRLAEACRELDVRSFFYIGGNDSSDACRIVNESAREVGYEMRCFHVPKTVDNDLMESDHTPGFPSAARFVATAFRADSRDNASIPGIKVNVVMGRHAGFLTAAAALAREHDDDGPHLVYLPELPFDTERFIADVDRAYTRLGRCQIAVSEGIANAEGVAIGAALIEGAQRDAHGNAQLSGSGALGDLLSSLIKKGLTPTGGKAIRVRADTFGYLQRCWPDPSPIDAVEARGVGRFAAGLARDGHADGSVAIVRTGSGVNGEPYASDYKRIELTDVAAKTKYMPENFFDGHCNISSAFLEYCRPLVGSLQRFGTL
jgi:ATP-dependent phosphofructokinase / diphosphate-dependent phosphofructokinase